MGYIGVHTGAARQTPAWVAHPVVLEWTTPGKRGQEISWLRVAIPLALAHTPTVFGELLYYC